MHTLSAKDFAAAWDLIQTHQKILIITHQRPDGDAVGSSLALQEALASSGKSIDCYCADPVPEKYSFLPAHSRFMTKFQTLDLVVKLQCKKTAVDRVSYNIVDDVLYLVITPVKGEFESEDISLGYGKPNYDLIITLDTPELTLLGELYSKNQEFFGSTPILNIDHHVSNTKFGQVNLVEPGFPSTGEVLYHLMTSTAVEISASMATALMTAIVTDTGSFQHVSTTAGSFSIAAKLMDKGGDLQAVIENVYRRKTVSQLKLWGRILTRVKQDAEAGLVWTAVSQRDISETKSSEEEAQSALNDLIVGIPHTKVALMLCESADKTIRGSLRTGKGYNASAIAALFDGGGHEPAAGFGITDKTLDEAEKYVLQRIREYLSATPVLKAATPAPSPSLTPEQIIDKIGEMMKVEEAEKKAQEEAEKKAAVPAVPAAVPVPVKDEEKKAAGE